jgi:hypothetical protein
VVVKYPVLGTDRAEIIVAMGHMLHGVLAKTNMWAFSKASIFSKLTSPRTVPHAAKVGPASLSWLSTCHSNWS